MAVFSVLLREDDIRGLEIIGEELVPEFEAGLLVECNVQVVRESREILSSDAVVNIANATQILAVFFESRVTFTRGQFLGESLVVDLAVAGVGFSDLLQEVEGVADDIQVVVESGVHSVAQVERSEALEVAVESNNVSLEITQVRRRVQALAQNSDDAFELGDSS